MDVGGNFLISFLKFFFGWIAAIPQRRHQNLLKRAKNVQERTEMIARIYRMEDELLSVAKRAHDLTDALSDLEDCSTETEVIRSSITLLEKIDQRSAAAYQEIEAGLREVDPRTADQGFRAIRATRNAYVQSRVAVRLMHASGDNSELKHARRDLRLAISALHELGISLNTLRSHML